MFNDIEECRAYVVYLMAQHRHLRQAVHDVQQQWSSIDATSPTADALRELIDDLLRLRKDLEQHFREEEEGGCIEEAVARHPGLSPGATDVTAEHPVLLEKLDRVINLLRELADGQGSTAHVSLAFEDFFTKLHDHETAETRIIQDGFGLEYDDY